MRDYLYKIVLTGDSRVGKTTLVNRFIHNKFIEQFKRTIGVDIYVKAVDVRGKAIKLQIWDIGGEERFKVVLPSYLNNVDGVMFLFDLSDINSLNRIGDWYDLVKSHNLSTPILLVGTKSDLYERNDKDLKMVGIAQDHYDFFGYMETSSKLGINVEESFHLIAHQIHDNIKIIQ